MSSVSLCFSPDGLRRSAFNATTAGDLPVLRWEYNIRVPKWAILPAYTFARVSTSNLPTEPADP